METEVPPTPNQSSVGMDYHRIKTPKLTGRLHNTSWSHAQSYGTELDSAEWLSGEKQKTTVIRNVPKLKIHQDEFQQSPRTAVFSQNLTQYEKMLQEIDTPHPQFRLVYPRHMLTSIRKVTGLDNFIIQPNAIAPTPEERYNITREQIIKLEAPKVDSGYTAHVSHRPEFENKHFQQWIEGALITEPQGVVSYPREEVMERSHTVPENLLLADYQDLDLGNMREDVVFTKEYLDSLDTPVRRSLMRLRERQIRDRYAFQAKDNQRVRTREYLHKQLTRTNYISSSLSVMMAAGDQTTFERDLTWKTARKIEILRNKSRSTPLVPYGILYPRIGGVTRFQGRPTKGEISLIEKRVENMSKNIVDNKEQLKAWKQSEIPEPEIILDSKSETRNISAFDLVTPCEKRQIAEDEAKIFRMKNSFEKLPNIDTRTAEILARSITEEERREKEAESTNELMSMSHDFKTEARRGKMPKGTLYKSSLTQKDKNSDSKDPKSDQFGLGRVNLPNPPSQKKQARRTVRMRPVFPVKEKAPPSFEFTEDVKTPSHGNLPLQKDELGVDNKVFITQPRENSNFLIGAEDATESLTRANSGKKSVTFDESINRNEDSENNDENSAANETTMEENVLENQENGKTKENVQGIEQNENEEVYAKKNAAEATPDRQETHETLESLTAEAQTEESTFQVTPEDGLQTIQESPTE